MILRHTLTNSYVMNLWKLSSVINFLPRVVAHVFRVLSKSSIVGYLVDNYYNKTFDKGILWSSIGYNWKIKNPNVSKIDKNFRL